jgi:threonine dehydrogenase-like Zn-dependent dehydrogenase
LAGVKPGDSVVIYGAGPVGLMAAHSASIKGPVKLWWWIVILTDSSLLELGAIPIDFSKGSAVEQVLELPKAWVLIRVANA